MEAAEQLFAERGVRAVSIRDIAAAAGVNSALIAYHFGSKEELFFTVYQAVAEPMNVERTRRLDALDRLGAAADASRISSMRGPGRFWSTRRPGSCAFREIGVGPGGARSDHVAPARLGHVPRGQ